MVKKEIILYSVVSFLRVFFFIVFYDFIIFTLTCSYDYTENRFELQDLHVSETMPQLISISESYMLIYEKKTA